MKQKGKRKTTPVKKRKKSEDTEPNQIDSNVNELEWLDEEQTSSKKTNGQRRKSKKSN
ncbi:hypothetical protein GZH47_08855 [Paenibacillus rhizovicinus]|uniref:Uncharacterized protein n=1 Tax=Paenibacillus rhizovicinus TaxID=2704463 RepID=A0A6C0NXJ8_9BACL|nr:hypothetical protein [Paenibacillus rhizovicinus]QHW30950.1 hypothetical protein GZH47_08855 [Paenibacillus rhizovicinus]